MRAGIPPSPSGFAAHTFPNLTHFWSSLWVAETLNLASLQISSAPLSSPLMWVHPFLGSSAAKEATQRPSWSMRVNSRTIP